MPELTIKLGDTVLQTHTFENELLRIGRSRENDIVLENLGVSRHHVQIRFHDGAYVLFDMNSSNGTYLNGVRITRSDLQDCDQITIGKHVLYWRDSSMQSTVVESRSSRPLAPPLRNAVKDPRAQAWVRVDSGKLTGREFKVVRFETSIGKAATNDIVLTDDWLLSKKQAIILRKGNDEFEIQDLGGIRRVKVNGKVVDDTSPLRTGDKLEVGGTKLVFFSSAAEHPSPPAQILMKDPHNATPEPMEEKSAEPEPAVAAIPEHEDFGLEDLLEPAALVARESLAMSNGNGSHSHPPVDASKETSRAGDDNAKAKTVKSDLPARFASAAKVSPVSHSSDQINPDVSDKEIEMWESALTNPSPAIRRQAARMLKKLTGRDYEA